MGTILDTIISGDYINFEGELSEIGKQIVGIYKSSISKKSENWKQEVKSKLEEVIKIMRENREEINKRVEYLNESESILSETIDKFEENDIIEVLKEKNIDLNILNIANTQFSDAYSDILEFKYRLGIISYKKLIFKREKRTLETEIEEVQNYIDAFEE